jgi:hypothetical protein
VGGGSGKWGQEDAPGQAAKAKPGIINRARPARSVATIFVFYRSFKAIFDILIPTCGLLAGIIGGRLAIRNSQEAKDREKKT